MMHLVEIGFIKASKVRKAVFLCLKTYSKTPSEIKAKTGLHLPQISRTLKELGSYGLIEIANPGSRKGKLFQLTKKGSMVLATLQKIGD